MATLAAFEPMPTATATAGASRNWVRALRDFAAAARAAGERCELCGRAIATVHDHLLELASRRTICACASCATGLESARVESARLESAHLQSAPLQSAAAPTATIALRRVPSAATPLADFHLSDADWDALMIPIGLAFFFVSSAEGRVVAMYPGPAGAVESLLELDAWNSLLGANPVLATLEDDVEALLVHRIGAARQYFRAPIDRCFGLAGLIRTRWHGLSGGAAVQEAIGRFFTDMSSGSRSLNGGLHA